MVRIVHQYIDQSNLEMFVLNFKKDPTYFRLLLVTRGKNTSFGEFEVSFEKLGDSKLNASDDIFSNRLDI